jgi:hypothetical protein
MNSKNLILIIITIILTVIAYRIHVHFENTRATIYDISSDIVYQIDSHINYLAWKSSHEGIKCKKRKK